MYKRDTIAAISTPVGEGGIGIVRISGDQSATIAGKIFSRNNDGGLKSHRFYYGRIIVPSSDLLLDEGMMVYMRSPHSYTREDVVEIHCHGGYLLVQRLLDLVINEGARLAEPGEFTKRAFLNGRVDLLQAEAVIDIIRSKSDKAIQLAEQQREGIVSRKIHDARSSLISALALVEAWLDFPEDDLDDLSREKISSTLEKALVGATDLVSGYGKGRIIREGVAVAILGKPNVGKSSLLNTLLQENRAIVTNIPGTTRDVIEEVISINGLAVKLIDTAGIRHTEDLVEQEGVQRSLDKIAVADLILFLVDGSQPFAEDDVRIAATLLGKNVVVVKTKGDLPSHCVLPESFADIPAITVSTLSGSGMEELRKFIYSLFIGGGAADSRDLAVISNARHLHALTKTVTALERAEVGIEQGVELELIAADLREALSALGEITGETTPDEILDEIFSRFCIGK